MLSGKITSLSSDLFFPGTTFNSCRTHKITFHIFIIRGMGPACLKSVDTFQVASCFTVNEKEKVTNNLTIGNKRFGSKSICNIISCLNLLNNESKQRYLMDEYLRGMAYAPDVQYSDLKKKMAITALTLVVR